MCVAHKIRARSYYMSGYMSALVREPNHEKVGKGAMHSIHENPESIQMCYGAYARAHSLCLELSALNRKS